MKDATLKKDAARYRWLKSRKGLCLRSEWQFWKKVNGPTIFSSTHYLADGGTVYGPAPTLDDIIDGAMKLDAERKKHVRRSKL